MRSAEETAETGDLRAAMGEWMFESEQRKQMISTMDTFPAGFDSDAPVAVWEEDEDDHMLR